MFVWVRNESATAQGASRSLWDEDVKPQAPLEKPFSGKGGNFIFNQSFHLCRPLEAFLHLLWLGLEMGKTQVGQGIQEPSTLNCSLTCNQSVLYSGCLENVGNVHPSCPGLWRPSPTLFGGKELLRSSTMHTFRFLFLSLSHWVGQRIHGLSWKRIKWVMEMQEQKDTNLYQERISRPGQGKGTPFPSSPTSPFHHLKRFFSYRLAHSSLGHPHLKGRHFWPTQREKSWALLF